MKPRLIFLVGPTAVGKTEIACALARKLGSRIISCDSMQVYKGMDIITAKPAPALREKIAHYLIDIISPTKEYNVSRYRRDALLKIKEIIKEGRTPLLVGGAGLYMSILIDGIFQPAALNQKIRRLLYLQAEEKGSAFLHAKLKKIDLEAAAKIHPNDTKRIIRALEVFKTTGKPISELKKQRKGLSSKYEIRIFCLDMPRDKLYKRIEARVDKMLEQGLIQEVKDLLQLKISKTASCAIGIKELKGYLEGKYSLEEAKLMIKRNSCLYAKRQLTWFRKDKRIRWIEIADQEKPAVTAGRILRELQWKELY